MKRFAVLLMVFAIVLSLAACTPAESGVTETPTEASTEPQLTIYEPPAGAEIRSVLMIGNSNCSYFNDELLEIARADGIEMIIANLYISGCSVEKHVEQMEYKMDYTKYTVRTVQGTTVYDNEINLQEALAERQWDAITLQQHYDPLVAKSVKVANGVTNRYAKKIYDYLKQEQPGALLFWQQMWAFQLGYPGTEVVEEKRIETVEKQSEIAEVIRQNSMYVCDENQAYRIPVGDAWQIARADERIGHTLSNKNSSGDTDYIHDGEVGGGQYLNACVWYEVLTQQSCIGNTFRPGYGLSEEKVILLQQIAHNVVAELYGADYAK